MNNTTVKNGTYFYNDEPYTFNFVTSLSASNKAVFVRTVVDTIVDDDNYDSVLKDIIFDYTTISMFTDIDTSFLKVVDDMGNMITDIDLLEDFLFSTNVVEVVKSNATPTLFDELDKAVNQSIEYRTGIHSSPLSESLASLVSTLEKKINELDMDSMTDMANVLGGMVGDITPESIVNAYMSSDVHKKNLAEIEDARKQKVEFAEDMDKAISLVNKR